jgi:hypothetical protein
MHVETEANYVNSCVVQPRQTELWLRTTAVRYGMSVDDTLSNDDLWCRLRNAGRLKFCCEAAAFWDVLPEEMIAVRNFTDFEEIVCGFRGSLLLTQDDWNSLSSNRIVEIAMRYARDHSGQDAYGVLCRSYIEYGHFQHDLCIPDAIIRRQITVYRYGALYAVSAIGCGAMCLCATIFAMPVLGIAFAAGLHGCLYLSYSLRDLSDDDRKVLLCNLVSSLPCRWRTKNGTGTEKGD